MFDDPKKELQRMQRELLAAEQETEEEVYTPFEDYTACGDYDEEEQLLKEAKMLIGDFDDEPPIRNHANGYGNRRTVSAPQKAPPAPKNPAVDFNRTVFSDEEFDEKNAVLVEEQPKGIGGLLLLAILEVLGILAIVGWWIQWLM